MANLIYTLYQFIKIYILINQIANNNDVNDQIQTNPNQNVHICLYDRTWY